MSADLIVASEMCRAIENAGMDRYTHIYTQTYIHLEILEIIYKTYCDFRFHTKLHTK